MKDCYEIYEDNAGLYRWRYWSSNSRKIADSAESYHNKSDCQRGIDIMKASADKRVVDSTASTSSYSRF